MIEFDNVNMPTSLVTKNMSIDSIEAINSDESRDILPLDSAFSAVLRILLKNRSKFTKRLIGNILPFFDT